MTEDSSTIMTAPLAAPPLLSGGSTSRLPPPPPPPLPLSFQIVLQLYEQETKTIQRMAKVMEVLHTPLQDKSKGILSFSQHWALFSNLATLHESHKLVHELLGRLVETLRKHQEEIAQAAAALSLSTQSGVQSRVTPSIRRKGGSFKTRPPPLSIPRSSGLIPEEGDADAALTTQNSMADSVMIALHAANNNEIIGHDRTSSQASEVYASPGTPPSELPSVDWTVESTGAAAAATTTAAVVDPHRTRNSNFGSGGFDQSLNSCVFPQNDTFGSSNAVEQLLDVFCGPAMTHYLAEHMMYTLHCCRTIFPTLTGLICAMKASSTSWMQQPSGAGITGGATQTSGPTPVAASMPAMNDKILLLQKYSKFVHYVYQVCHSHRGEELDGGKFPSSAAAAPPPPPSRLGHLLDDWFLPSADLLTPCRDTTHPVKAKAEQQAGLRKTTAADNRGDGKANDDDDDERHSTIPPLDELLLHLAAPLASLQRYVLVSRCLLECKCLSSETEDELFTKFVTVGYQRFAEEGSLVLDQVSQQDVAAIVANFDDFNGAPNENRILVHSGRLVKKFRRGRHERLMFVFSDMLVYVEELSTGRHRVRGMIPLADEQPDVQVLDVEDNPVENIANGFHIVASNGVTYHWFAPSAVQKHQWLNVLNFVLNGVKRAKAKSAQQQLTGDVPSLVRTEVERVPRNSRLEKQRREDHRVQHIADKRFAKVSRVPSSSGVGGAMPLPLSSVRMGGESPPAAQPSSPAGLLNSSITLLRASVRRQASLRGSYTAAQWASELASMGHNRVRSSDLVGALKHQSTIEGDVSLHPLHVAISREGNDEEGDNDRNEKASFEPRMPPSRAPQVHLDVPLLQANDSNDVTLPGCSSGASHATATETVTSNNAEYTKGSAS